MKYLTWQQVNTWRLSKQSLLSRKDKRDFLDVATDLIGVQSQVLSAAQLAIATRTNHLAKDVTDNALWKDRTLIKTWAMRGTLHLISSDELPIIVAARSLATYDWHSYFAYYGISKKQHDVYTAAIPHILEQGPLTREQLAKQIVQHTGVTKFEEIILSSGWGSPLKFSAFQGNLAFGPSQGQHVTFVNPKTWMKHWQDISPEEALKHIIRQYIAYNGPTTPQLFALWWGGGAGVVLAKKAFASMHEELEEVDVEGWQGYALKKTLTHIQKLNHSHTVHLLPLFDAYTFGLVRGIDTLLPDTYKLRIFRPQGWISAVVLVDGYIKGTWEYKIQGKRTTIHITMFSPPSPKIQKEIQDEVARIGVFLASTIEIKFND